MNEWFSPSELANLALPGMPASRKGVDLLAAREMWTRVEWNGKAWRPRVGRGGGVEFHFGVLPDAARSHVARLIAADRVKRQTPQTRALPPGSTVQGELFRAEMWARWDRMSDKRKNESRRRLEILQTIDLMVASGSSKGEAVAYAMATFGDSQGTIYNYRKTVRGYHKADWMAVLPPDNCGTGKRAELSPEAFEFIKADWLQLGEPCFTDCWRRLKLAAKEHGWKLPSSKTVERRLQDIPRTLIKLGREGERAVEGMFPAQTRDKSAFHALEAVNIDGHEWDVFVRFPDGHVGRPVMVAIQDVYSAKFLGWRFGVSENMELVRLCIGDVVETFGIFDHLWCDNGHAFTAKWLTGGVKNRYRFKVKQEDPIGILPQLGVQVHFCKPHHGQSKPIERGFRDVAQSTRHPKFDGAYAGNSPTNKPANYGSHAVSWDLFVQVANEIMFELNSRIGRESAVCKGRSFDQAFAESYAVSPIRMATEEQQRLWLMCAEPLRASKKNGEIKLEDNRYWHQTLCDFAGQRLVVRFDPQALHDDLHVYQLDGRYLCAAPCVQPVGFADMEAANTHGRDRRSFLKAQKALFAAEQKLSLSDLAALLPKSEPAEPLPPPKIVRLVHGANALAVAPAMDADEEVSPGEELMRRGMDLLASQRRAAGGGLRLVEDAD